jgi:hypothetical protein
MLINLERRKVKQILQRNQEMVQKGFVLIFIAPSPEDSSEPSFETLYEVVFLFFLLNFEAI